MRHWLFMLFLAIALLLPATSYASEEPLTAYEDEYSCLFCDLFEMKGGDFSEIWASLIRPLANAVSILCAHIRR